MLQFVLFTCQQLFGFIGQVGSIAKKPYFAGKYP